jgi:hypothetical protein
MLGWLVVFAVLLCSSCAGHGESADTGPEGPPATVLGTRGETQETPQTPQTPPAPDDSPCRRACALAAMAGCVNVSALCADGGWPLFAVVGGIGILCSKAMVAACSGSTGLPTCQASCAQ